MDDVSERVARGAALLDEQRPGWDGEIDLDTLDLANRQTCLFGQLFGGWEDGLDALGLQDTARPMGSGALPYGFDISCSERIGHYAPLTAEWKRVIRARRANDA